MNSAFQLTLHDYSASIDVGFHAPVRSDDQTVSFRVDGAFYLAIYIKVFAAREFPFNHNRLADAGHVPEGSTRRFERFHECNLLGKLLGSVIFLFYSNAYDCTAAEAVFRGEQSRSDYSLQNEKRERETSRSLFLFGHYRLCRFLLRRLPLRPACLLGCRDFTPCCR